LQIQNKPPEQEALTPREVEDPGRSL